MTFWEIVKKSGHTEKEISEEVIHLILIFCNESIHNFSQLDNLIDGKAWVKFNKFEEFVRKDKER